jgi:hypothetical protein
MRPINRLTFAFAFAFAPALAACDAQPLAAGITNTADTGEPAVAISQSATCIGTMASFDQGLRADLAASVGPERRTPSSDVAVDGVHVTAGYGVDLVVLETGFSVNRQWGQALAGQTLSFGGWRNPQSTGRDARALQAAEQLWTALAGAVETVDARNVTRTTRGGRAVCWNDRTSVSVHCALGGFISLDAAEIPCPGP